MRGFRTTNHRRDLVVIFNPISRSSRSKNFTFHLYELRSRDKNFYPYKYLYITFKRGKNVCYLLTFVCLWDNNRCLIIMVVKCRYRFLKKKHNPSNKHEFQFIKKK